MRWYSGVLDCFLVFFGGDGGGGVWVWCVTGGGAAVVFQWGCFVSGVVMDFFVGVFWQWFLCGVFGIAGVFVAVSMVDFW